MKIIEQGMHKKMKVEANPSETAELIGINEHIERGFNKVDRFSRQSCEYFHRELQRLHAAMTAVGQHAEVTSVNTSKQTSDRPRHCAGLVGDPSAERLLEGFAYISAQLQQIADDDLSEISETVLSQLAPELLQSIPSMTIMRFTPDLQHMQASKIIKKNTLLWSEPVGEPGAKRRCGFRTTHDCVVHPLQVVAVDAHRLPHGGGQLTLRLKIPEWVDLNTLPLQLFRLYLHADADVSAALYWCFRHTLSCHVRLDDPSRQAGDLSVHHDLSIWQDTNRDVLSRIRQYMHCPMAQHFIAVNGLETIVFPMPCTDLTLCFEFQQPLLARVAITPDMFQLHCIPVVNTYLHSAEPVVLDASDWDYPFYLDAQNIHGLALQHIKSVTGWSSIDNQQISYFPVHQKRMEPSSRRYYKLSQSFSKTDGMHYVLSFSSMPTDHAVIVSCKALVNNTHYPSQYLNINDRFQFAECEEYMTCANLTRPSVWQAASSQKHCAWQLIGHLFYRINECCDLPSLHTLLTHCVGEQEKAIVQRVVAFTSLSHQVFPMLHRGCWYSMIRITLTVEEKGFAHVAQIYEWGEMLQALFLATVPANLLLNLQLVCQPSQTELSWPPSLGMKTCL